MARTIRVKKNYIPVPIVDEVKNDDGELVEKQLHELRFYRTDENLENIYNQGEVIDDLTKEVDEEDNESGKKVVREAFDSVFGEGEFDAVYKINPSTLIMLEYFISAIIIIREELDDSTGAEALEKYLK